MKFLARKEAKTCLRKAGAKNSPWRTSSPLWIPKNPPRRTSLSVFSVIICVKIIPPRFRGAGYRNSAGRVPVRRGVRGRSQSSSDTSTLLYRRLRGSDYQPPPHNPRFYRGSSKYRSRNTTGQVPSDLASQSP